MEYDFIGDLNMVMDVRGYSIRKMADAIGVNQTTLSRWLDRTTEPDPAYVSRFYAYTNDIKFDIKGMRIQLYQEDYKRPDSALLFHGARTELIGELSLKHSLKDNDFGRGFYCGETLEQAGMYVSGFSGSSVYILALDKKELKCETFSVNTDWVLSVAYYRGWLKEYEGHPKLMAIIKKVEATDYVYAPIADNQMFEQISDFANAFITDEQCCHSMSATDLGYQYVFTKENALKQLTVLYRCFLTEQDRQGFKEKSNRLRSLGMEKVKYARKKYRGVGQTIDQILS